MDRPRKGSGFTLLEVLVAVAIMAISFAIVWSTFSATVNGWQRGTKLLDQLHQGDYLMEQFVIALRSAAFFSSTRPDKYGFRLDAHGGGEDSADVISWVTSGSAFLPPDSYLANGLHRLEVSLDRDNEGRPAVAVRAWPHLADEEEDVEGEPWFVSTEVKGLRCRTYNAEEERWDHEWENTSSVPRLVEITLYLPPLEKYDEPQKLQRLVEIPIAPPLEEAARSSGEGGTTGEPPPETTTAPAETAPEGE
ncbi:MAG: type II secretion system GspH family protein [Verrucomicrobia bacterium]|nr:type II secretion system GspH family protein [Verrucomicrobiota bacterium]